MSEINFSIELHSYNSSLNGSGAIETKAPSMSTLSVDDFREGTHFRTGAETGTNYLQLELEDRILTMILDESGSMTWNDNNSDRYTYLKRLLTKLEETYPATISTNLIGFGGVLADVNIFTAKAGRGFVTSTGQDTQQFIQNTFEESIYNFSGVRVLRRTDRYPLHPADGVVVVDGIVQAAKDSPLIEGQQYYYGIWSFNAERHYSPGQFIKGTPKDRLLPKGVNFASATAKSLHGVQRDSSTSLIYHFQEGSGYLVFDSSGNGNHGTIGTEVIEHNFWAGDSSSNSFDENGNLKKKVGVRFDGEFDIIESDAGEDLALRGYSTGNQSLTVNLWIYRYPHSETEWLIGTSTQDISNNIGWMIGVTSDGNLAVAANGSLSGIQTLVGDQPIPQAEWVMLTVVFAITQFGYDISWAINGETNSSTLSNSDGTYFNTSDNNKLYIGAKPVVSGASWNGTDFFGVINEISIHSTTLSSDDIFSLYQTEGPIFNQTISESETNPLDNKQREVLLNWIVGNDFDYQDIKIVRKYLSIPSHDEDGDLVETISASEGEFFYLDTYDFIHNSNYYYRIFTSNSSGLNCDRSEARVLSVHIPKSVNPSASIEPVLSESILEGDRRLFLQWVAPNDNRIVGTKIYFGTRTFPTVSISPSGELQVSDGGLLVDTTRQSYVHRVVGETCDGEQITLQNGVLHFYTLVNYDKFGRISTSRQLVGIPTSSSTLVFPPAEITDLHIENINSETLSLQWKNPTVKASKLDLWFGETALIFVNIRDKIGGNLSDLDDMNFIVCTNIQTRPLKGNENSLNIGGNLGQYGSDLNPSIPCEEGGGRLGSGFGSPLDENCNSEQENAETVIAGSTAESGLLKGLLTHIGDKEILARREKYTMQVFGQYKIPDPNNEGQNIFEFSTESVTVSFQHPIQIRAVNKTRRFISLGCEVDGGVRDSERICTCPEDQNQDACNPVSFNGAYATSRIPYVCRVELQYKGESLPDGTPVRVELFKHDSENSLTIKSDRTFIEEGVYTTTAIEEEELDVNGEPTGNLISKSVVDIEVPCPSLPDYVDLYVSLDFAGFLVDVVHEVRFVSTLFIRLDASKPDSDGINVSEQFATVWQIDPDDPDPDNNVPVPDGTLVKWELTKGENGKDRPFYSTEEVPLISGVYSRTLSGVARNVFFGPVGNLERHFINLECSESAERCCLSEEYEIHVSCILDDETAIDAARIAYDCEDRRFSNRHFLMNAADPQPIGTRSSSPHYYTWADGEHLIKFQISRNAALTNEMLGWRCFIDCTESEQLLEIPENYIAQINAPGEILWNVTFEEDPYTGELTPITYDSVQPDEDGNTSVANIPLTGLITDFYLRLNKFLGDGTVPKPSECESGAGGGDGLGGDGNSVSPCEWVGFCNGVASCAPGGEKWDNVEVVNGTVTLIANNRQITLFGGGNYETGVPPIYAGFQEPLDVRVVDARANGQRITEFTFDTRITFVVEARFAGEPVPDGTPIEITISDDSSGVVRLSDCFGVSQFCDPATNGIIYTQQLNDSQINPTGEERALAYFTVDPIANIDFSSSINVTCRYDKVGTATREISRCISLRNSVAQDSVDPPVVNPNNPEDIPEQESASNSELIVYDTVDDTYRRSKPGQVNRMGHFFTSGNVGTADLIYSFAGWSIKGTNSRTGITSSCEVFETASETWSYTSDMPTPRCYGMTAKSGDYIYCIGGVEKTENDQLEVSQKIESFDTVTETWNPTLSPMPVGVAFGDAQVYNNEYIYVTCGINTLEGDNRAGTLNSVILRYSIANDEWITIEPSNVSLYQRISPLAFYRNPSNPDISDLLKKYYIYSGSIPKPAEVIESERSARISELLNEFRSLIVSSSYFQNLSITEQENFISMKEEEIRNGVVVPAFYYPLTGFKFLPQTETFNGAAWTIDISDTLDDDWTVLPLSRDHGQCVYIPHQDIAYFMGGSNQNLSTTLNRVESIDLSSFNLYERRTSFDNGRSHFGATRVGDDIYISGGLKSGHASGWVQINVTQEPDQVEALGKQSSGMLVTLTNDSGEVVEDSVRIDVRGRVKVPEIDSTLIDFLAERAAIRALGGEYGQGIPDAPSEGDTLDISRLIKAQNSIIDPNSDTFQRNAASKLNERIFLFPVLYSTNDLIARSGVGGFTLLPRSEDPLADFQRLATFIDEILRNTPGDTDERFAGDLTRDELAALGDVLTSVSIPPIVINSNAVRPLYGIETVLTVLDDFYFGQTISEFDIQIQNAIDTKIEELLTPPLPEDNQGDDNGQGSGDSSGSGGSTCFVLEHAANPDLPQPPPGGDNGSSPFNPSGNGSFSNSGQCLFCKGLIPLAPDIRDQLPTVLTGFYNIDKWVPQIKKYLIENTSTIRDALDVLNNIEYEVPFGSSQIWDATVEAAIIMSGELFEDTKKVIYILSDNSENLSRNTRFDAIEEINSVDGDRNTPVVYTVFSTSHPVSIAAMLQRNEDTDIETIAKETGGQSSTLIASGFLNYILNLTLGGAVGGLGYGIYNRLIDLEEISSITSMNLDFSLPSNTAGTVRIRSSNDGYNYTDWSEKYTGSGTHDFTDFTARYVEFEVVLSTGFTIGTEEEYDDAATGIPKLRNIILYSSAERQDYIYLNTEDVLTNAQQVAMAFEGTVPNASIVELGVATSNSHQWNEFYSTARPIVKEFGKTFLLERDNDADSVVSSEIMTTDDNILYKTVYGPWDSGASVEIFKVDTTGAHAGEDVAVLSGFRAYSSKGEIYFDTRQPPDRIFKIKITNAAKMRVGMKLRNRLHSDTIKLEGVGFIYSTNDEKPALISQVAPTVLNVTVSPISPSSDDTIFALYKFVDLNNDKEQGTLISWFKNGRQLFEIQNKLSWSNSDLLPSNKLLPNDKILYKIIPSDGRDYGNPVYSPQVTIVARPPEASDLRIVPIRNGVINNRYDTSSTFTVEYDFAVEDSGPNSVETGTSIKWFVNGVLFKEGTFSELNQDPYSDPKSITPDEQIGGSNAHVIGNQIQVEVTPRTSLITGSNATSSSITVVNSIPIATNVSIQPLLPNRQSTLSVSYDIGDSDIDNNIQTDQSEIKWYSSVNGSDFLEIEELRNETTVTPFYLRAGQYWYAKVAPFDGLDLGSAVTSNIVNISV